MIKVKKTYFIITILVAAFVVVFLHYSGKLNLFPDKIMGLDVSSHQGSINWDLVAKSGIKFVYIKATEGNDFKDNKFEYNFEVAKNVGIKVGAYHYYSLAYGGEVQAKNFLETVPFTKEQLPPVIDLEYVGNSKQRPSKADFQKELNIYIDIINRSYGREPILYTTGKFYKDYLYPEFINKVFWKRSLLYPPENSTFWQYSQWGKIDGINGAVDLDFFRGNDSDFEKYFQI